MSRKDAIYRLLDDLGANTDIVLAELICWLDAEQIEEFVDDFRRLNNMIDDKEDDEDTEHDEYSATFFSSLVPEC